ncbi:MAG TPA: hypothetical protein ENH82_11185 [bacterium]|nr:hypothetical protein [bacterium]
MKTHTKGKWESVGIAVKDKRDEIFYHTDILCNDTIRVARSSGVGEDLALANARLIAAAPYLYETAKEFIAGWSHFCKCIDFGQSFLDAEAIRFMNEVPAKIATGIVKAEKGI